MGDDGGVVAGSSGEFAAISQLLLELADDGSLWHDADWHNVSDRQVGLLATVDELTSVHALDRDERLLALLEPGEGEKKAERERVENERVEASYSETSSLNR